MSVHRLHCKQSKAICNTQADCFVVTPRNDVRLSAAYCLLITACCFLLFACKTTSRTASASLYTGTNTSESTLSKDTFKIGDATFRSLTTETVTDRPTIVFVNGEEQVVIETTTQRQTAVSASQRDSSNTQLSGIFLAARDTSSFVDLLHRDTEGMEVIPDIVSGITTGFFDSIFGPIGKIIVSIILMILLVMVLTYAFKRPTK